MRPGKERRLLALKGRRKERGEDLFPFGKGKGDEERPFG